jgi:hypothetical protein
MDNNAPSTLSQDYWNFNENSDSDEPDQIAPGSQCHKRTAKRTNIYEKLNPIFKSLVAAMESTEATLDDVEEAFQDMLKIEAKFKERFGRKSRHHRSSLKSVSSSLADNPKRKTHGTKNM